MAKQKTTSGSPGNITLATMSLQPSLLNVLLTHDVQPLPIEQITETDLRFLGFCRVLGWGAMETVVKDGLPVMGHITSQSWKFS